MQELVYKGATRPALLSGVPLVPAVLVGGLGILGMSYSLVLTRSIVVAAVVLSAMAAGWVAMVVVTRRDDQRLMQYLLRWRLRQSRGSRRMWGALSYSPGAVRGMRDRPQR